MEPAFGSDEFSSAMMLVVRWHLMAVACSAMNSALLCSKVHLDSKVPQTDSNILKISTCFIRKLGEGQIFRYVMLAASYLSTGAGFHR